MPKRAKIGARQDAQKAVPAMPANKVPAPPPTAAPTPLYSFFCRMAKTCMGMNRAYNNDRATIVI